MTNEQEWIKYYQDVIRSYLKALDNPGTLRTALKEKEKQLREAVDAHT